MNKVLCLVFVLCVISLVGCTSNIDLGEDSSNKIENSNLELVNTSDLDFEYIKSSDNNCVYITKYIGTEDYIIIPEEIENLPVTSLIGYTDEETNTRRGAFEGTNVKTLVLSKNLQAIGYKCLLNCDELATVIVPSESRLNTISSHAFENCILIEHLDFSSAELELIDDYAFAGCSKVKEVLLSDNLTEIGERAFYECFALSEIILPENITTIGAMAFGYCTDLKEINIPKNLSLLALEEAVFYENSALTKIDFEEGHKKIIGYAFFDLKNDVEITIPQSVEEFSAGPFFINDNVTFIFLGDCPSIIENTKFTGKPTIYYNSKARGWNDCFWNNVYNLVPIN